MQGLALDRQQGKGLASLGSREGTPITVMGVNVARTWRRFGAIISYAEGQEDFIEMRFDFIFERSLEPRNSTDKDR